MTFSHDFFFSLSSLQLFAIIVVRDEQQFYGFLRSPTIAGQTS